MTDKPKPIEGEVFGPGEFIGEQSGSRFYFEGTASAPGKGDKDDDVVVVVSAANRYSFGFDVDGRERKPPEAYLKKALATVSKRIDRDVLAGLMGAQDVTPKPAPKSRRLK